MNHCCEKSFLSFKCDGLQAADQRGRAEGCSLSVSLLRVAYRDFFLFFQAEGDSPPARLVTSSGLITPSAPPK